MLFVLILIGVFVISTFIRYHPHLDLVLSYDRYILLLWYNKDGRRTYTTRHGNGYEPKYKLNINLSGKHETNVNNEYQGEFKVGALETTLMNRATERHRIDNYVSQFDCRLNLVVTHMDVVVDSGVFEYEQKFGKNAIIGAIEPKKVLEAITSHLGIPFDNVYYNDSIESNIKQML